MSKLALCFLVTKNIKNLDVFEQWISGYEHLVNIYAHFSEIGTIDQPILLKNRVHAVPTKWGDISLIYAEAELYKEALKNTDNAFFILLSENCIPVRSFEYTYNRLMSDKKRGILAYRDVGKFYPDDCEPFMSEGSCGKLLDKFGFYDHVYAADQWKALSRSNAKDFMKMLSNVNWIKLFTECIKIVPDSLAPDELFYVNYMNQKYGLSTQFRHGQVTMVDFTGKAVHPINYKQITPKTADLICESNSMFARKFPEPIPGRIVKQTPVSCKYYRAVSRGIQSKSKKSKKSKSKKSKKSKSKKSKKSKSKKSKKSKSKKSKSKKSNSKKSKK